VTQMAAEFRILTYNAWLAPSVIARDVEQRAARLPRALSEMGVDIIALQEVWFEKHQECLTRELALAGFRHTIVERGNRGLLRGAFGNGLLIASRFPVKRHALLEFSTYTHHEEYFVRKGALALTVEIPEIGDVDLINTHLGTVRFDARRACFVSRDGDRQLAQIEELVCFARTFSSADRLIVAGDLNMHFEPWHAPTRCHLRSERSRNYSRLSTELQLLDTFPRDVQNAPFLTVRRDNPYVAASMFAKGPSECVDYVLVSTTLRSVSASIVLAQVDQELGRPLSDHDGVLVTLDLS
jgi:endonuclease/exonuclease/phosphatase family metal-dependent hydrolase